MNRVDPATPAGDPGPYLSNWKYFYPFYRPPSPPRPPQGALYDVRAQLPPELPRDPRLWTRQNVQTWLEWCQEEFDLPAIDNAQFAMNGKALCLLLRSDCTERAPRAGDILYNVIQILMKETANINNHCHPPLRIFDYGNGGLPNQDHLRAEGLGSSWPIISSDYHNLGHVLHQPRLQVSPSTSGVESTVTLSPASTDSHSASPRHQSPPSSINHCSPDGSGDKQRLGTNALSDFEDSGNDSPVPSMMVDTEIKPVAKSAPPSDSPVTPSEPITNGRLLWDFLHQLLNDAGQRYVSCIHWKNRESGVFKITDPNVLARLWGMQKNHLNMNFDKMSRALRYYYRVNILRKVQGERHCYQFLRQPMELKACKQRALLNKFCPNDKPIDMTINTNTDSLLAAATAAIKTEDIDQ